MTAGDTPDHRGTDRATGLPLDPAPAQMRAMGVAAVEYLIGFVAGLDDAPAEATEGAVELARSLREAPPERGGDFEALFADVRDAVASVMNRLPPDIDPPVVEKQDAESSPIVTLAPGGAVAHTETWSLADGVTLDDARRRLLA